MESFQELGLPEFLGKSLKQMNFSKPTPVQAQAIPAALEGKDVIASAQTGTGKTAGFGIPLLTFLSKNPDQTALILTPTRELAAQVLEVLRKLTGTHHLGGSVLLIGGANMGGQISALLRKPRLIIGTPGRVIDHLGRGSLNLSKAGFLVLDEADRMLDMGFAPQLEEIRKRLPAQRQTLLFSATLPDDIKSMGARYLKDPVRIAVGETTQPIAKINQMVIHTSEGKKYDELTAELNERQGTVLVFARTQSRVERLAEKLKESGFKVTRVHGGRTQSQRRQAIEQFREGSYRILVATDIAARGLDIHHIAHVINYDLPRNPEDYIHRVGRTARAGAEGASLCLLTPEDRGLWERILRLIKAPRESIQNKPSRGGDFTPKPSAHVPQHAHQRAFKKNVPSGTPRNFSDRKPSWPRTDDHGPKRRHPDGRHQVRSEGHRARTGTGMGSQKDANGNPAIFHGHGSDGQSRPARQEWRPSPGGFGKRSESSSFNRPRRDHAVGRPEGRSFDRPQGRPPFRREGTAPARPGGRPVSERHEHRERPQGFGGDRRPQSHFKRREPSAQPVDDSFGNR
jgi:ATP-dependent RNA helicase DeaD